MDVDIKRVGANLQRRAKQRTQPFEVAQLHVERARLFGPGKVAAIGMVDVGRTRTRPDPPGNLDRTFTVQFDRQRGHDFFVPCDRCHHHVATHGQGIVRQRQHIGQAGRTGLLDFAGTFLPQPHAANYNQRNQRRIRIADDAQHAQADRQDQHSRNRREIDPVAQRALRPARPPQHQSGQTQQWQGRQADRKRAFQRCRAGHVKRIGTGDLVPEIGGTGALRGTRNNHLFARQQAKRRMAVQQAARRNGRDGLRINRKVGIKSSTQPAPAPGKHGCQHRIAHAAQNNRIGAGFGEKQEIHRPGRQHHRAVPDQPGIGHVERCRIKPVIFVRSNDKGRIAAEPRNRRAQGIVTRTGRITLQLEIKKHSRRFCLPHDVEQTGFAGNTKFVGINPGYHDNR